MSKQFDLLVFIGRFQPYHNGHHYVIQEALKLSRHVLVLVGSANKLPDSRNPFSFEERKSMIKESFPESYKTATNILVHPLNDYPYDENKWISEVQSEVSKVADMYGDVNKIGLIGHSKDHSSYYLKLFPNFESVDVKGVNFNSGELLNATDVRTAFFNKNIYKLKNVFEGLVPEGTMNFLFNKFNFEKYFNQIAEEMDFLKRYKSEWGEGPFVTVDAVIVQAGHVLLIERGDYPGKGQLALPGGFVEPRERLEDAVMRELKEETSIDVPPAVLKSKIVDMQHFAHPWRSNRAHIITFAFLFDLNSEIDKKFAHERNIGWKDSVRDKAGMTKVKGGDDAAKAMWYPLAELKSDMLFEDHHAILTSMLDKLAIYKLT